MQIEILYITFNVSLYAPFNYGKYNVSVYTLLIMVNSGGTKKKKLSCGGEVLKSCNW